ncbi:MAG: efflux RND transporter permease subunit [Chloroflexi bacterium]|nr:efflux RND transporter permease subunit [Chloroflexota bacterium]
MWLTNVAIKRPLFISMLLLFFVLVGAVSYTRLGADQYPQINIPYVMVVVAYPGAGPEEVESRVTKIVEDAVAGVSELKTLSSYSIDGLSAITMEFSVGADTDTAAIDVERKVSAIKSQLPEDAHAPNVIKSEFNSLPIMTVSLSGSADSDHLFQVANDKLKGRLEAVKGVASVRVVGGQDREIQVKVDQSQLRARGLSIQQVYSALALGNVSMPSGSIDEKGREYNVRYNALLQKPEELRDIVIASSPSGTVYLRDVANVIDGFKKQTIISRANGRDSIGLMITKVSNANTMLVANDLRKAISSFESTLPDGVELAIANDTSVFVKQSLDDIQSSLFYAVILTAIVLLLFLHTYRSTIIVLFSIPTSLISTFMLMWIMGFTLNMMSMMALALSIGILVDDSIVVLENIYRHINLGETPWSAALKGRSEIGMAAIAITLVDVVVYVPMAFMTGIVGQFFRQFGLTVAIATLFSLFVSFTLTPMLASRWLKPESETDDNSLMGRFGRAWEGGYYGLARAYGGLLAWALRHRKTVVAASFVIFFAALAMIPLKILGTEFLPPEDQGEVFLTVEMPPGTALSVTNNVVLQLEAKLSRLPEVESYFTTVGLSSSGFINTGESRYARIEVKLVSKDRRSKSIIQMARDLQKVGDGISGLTLRTQLPAIGGDPRQPFLVQLKGDDPVELKKLGAEITEIVKGIPGTADVTNSAAQGAPEVRVEADNQRLADLGLNSSIVATALRANVEGLVATQLQPEGRNRVDIRVVGSDADKSTIAGLTALPVASPKGVVTTLEQVTRLKSVESPAGIDRIDRQRVVTIGANVYGRPLGDVVDAFHAEMKGIELPAGFSYTLAGQTELMDESNTSLVGALFLSILLMYMLMVALYESFIYPLVIMFALPLSIVGALVGLFIAGHTLNISSMIGMIMLMGLVGKNGILLVDYTNTLRERGKSRFDAIIEAGPTRLRPILMTTSAMVMAMIPVAIQIGQGAETRSPMAVVVIGGMISSTLLTLVLVPVVYTLFDDASLWVRRSFSAQ